MAQVWRHTGTEAVYSVRAPTCISGPQMRNIAIRNVSDHMAAMCHVSDPVLPVASHSIGDQQCSWPTRASSCSIVLVLGVLIMMLTTGSIFFWALIGCRFNLGKLELRFFFLFIVLALGAVMLVYFAQVDMLYLRPWTRESNTPWLRPLAGMCSKLAMGQCISIASRNWPVPSAREKMVRFGAIGLASFEVIVVSGCTSVNQLIGFLLQVLVARAWYFEILMRERGVVLRIFSI